MVRCLKQLLFIFYSLREYSAFELATFGVHMIPCNHIGLANQRSHSLPIGVLIHYHVVSCSCDGHRL